MPRFTADILGRLAEASADELAQALAAIREDFAEIQGQPVTAESKTAVVALRDAVTAIRGEQQNRSQMLSEHGDAVNELASTFAELDAADTGATEGEGDTGTETGATGTESGATGGDGATGNEGTDDGATGDGDKQEGDDTAQEGEGSVTASARRPLGGTHTATATDTRQLAQVNYRTTASAGLQDIAPGTQLTRQQLREAMYAKVRATRNQPGYERYTVATVRAEYPEDRHLVASADADTNMAKVEAVVDQARGTHALRNGFDETGGALTAAGLCAPLETLYDIRTIGDTDRPVRDALVRFGVDRGGIQYRPALDGVTQTGGIGFWTVTNDEDMDPETPASLKTCVEIDCPGVVTAEVEAIYQCLTFSNMSTRFDPEFYDSVVRAQDIAHARIAENRLLSTLTTGSKAIYAPAGVPEEVLGGARRVLPTLDKMIAYYRNVHRLSDEVSLRFILPLWAKYLFRADITMQMVGDGLLAMALADEQINAWFRARNVNPTYHLDGIDPAELTVPEPDVPVPAQFYTTLAANSPVPAFPGAISSLLFAEGDWLFLDGGTLDVGVVRDSTLNAQNRFQTFSESFEYAANRGIESIHLVIPALPTGASAGTQDTYLPDNA